MNSPGSGSLRELLKARFEDERLDPQQLLALRDLQQSPADAASTAAAERGPVDPGRRRLFAIAASVAATGAVGYWGLFGLRAFRDTSNLDVLADEIALNQLMEKPLDVRSGSMDELRSAFATVGFMLQPAPMALPADAELIGGRHCSIASVPAVALRYRSESGFVGMCQARFDPARHRGVPARAEGQALAVRTARGCTVSLCHDHGVLMAVVLA